MTKMNPRITCIECGHKFDKYTGDMDVRMCLTCILKAEDPDVIKHDRIVTIQPDHIRIKKAEENKSYAEDIDQQAFAQGRQSSITDVHSEKYLDDLEKIADEVYARIEKEEIRPVTYESFIRTGMDNRSYVQLEKKIHDNYLLVNDRVNELLERIVVIEKEVRE